MPDPLSFRSLRETQRRVREIGAYGGAVEEPAPGDTIETHLIAISSESLSDGLYPACRYELDPVSGTKTQHETCWVRVVNDEPLIVGPYWWMKLTGAAADGKPIFSPNGPVFVYRYLCSGGSGSGSGSGSGGGNISRASLGTGDSGGASVTSLTIPDITLSAHALLIVNVACVGGAPTITASWGGNALPTQTAIALGTGAPIAGTLTMCSGYTVGGGTGDVVLSFSSSVAVMAELIEVLGFSGNSRDVYKQGAGISSAPDTGASGATATANEYAQGAFLMITPGGAWTWGNSFTDGAQDVSNTISGYAASLAEGYRVLSAVGTVDAALGSVTPAAWCGLAVTYK
jgi:hypothetical protein